MGLIQFRSICKSYDEIPVLKDIDYQVPSGKIIGLLGRNGAGKTTMIKIMNDLLVPDTGMITYNNKPLGIQSKESIAYLPERSYLDKSMSVKEIIKMFKDFYKGFNEDKCLDLLKEFNIDINLTISKLSKGAQEKLQLILVISRNAKIYILDEPLAGIDPATRDSILDIIKNSINKKSSVIISTHLIADVEKILDEVVFIDNGEIVLVSDVSALKKKKNGTIDEIFREMFKC